MKRTGLFGCSALLAASFGLALTASSGVAEADSIKIGAPFNVTGSLSSLDAPALNGAKLKAKEPPPTLRQYCTKKLGGLGGGPTWMGSPASATPCSM